MTTNDLRKFQEIINECKDDKPTILLGNGFSIGLHPKFKYRALKDKLIEELKELKELKELEELEEQNDKSKIDKYLKYLKVLEIIEIADFEGMMQATKIAEDIVKVYNENISFSSKDWNETLKKLFVLILKNVHPKNWNEIDEDNQKYNKLKNFLDYFKAFYTTNYDLLFYWAVNKILDENKEMFNDGFRKKNNILQFMDSDEQNLFYLHGALHLYNNSNHKHKYESGADILDKVAEAINSGNIYPDIVLEDESKNKLKAISRSSYLDFCFQKLKDLSGTLFIYGFAFNDTDRHISEAIFENEKLKHIYISLYNGDAKNVEHRVDKIKEKSKAEITYYEAESI